MENERLIIDLVRSAAEYESKIRIVEVKHGNCRPYHRHVPADQARNIGHIKVQEKERSVIKYR